MTRNDTLDDKFRAILATRIAAARAAVSQGDISGRFAREIHTIKGEAKLLGFVAVARVALHVEVLMRTGGAEEQLEEGLSLLDRLRSCAHDDAEALREAEAFEARVREQA